MSKTRIPYYVVRHGRGYFQIPKGRAAAAGFPSCTALGPDGPVTRRRAREWYEEFRQGRTPPPEPTPPEMIPPAPGEGMLVIPRKPSALFQFLLDHRNYEGGECLVPPVRVIGASGYIHVKVCGRQIGAHRAMLLLAKRDGFFHKAQAAHQCGNPSCVNPSHLKWATAKVNAADRVIHGTVKMGKRSRPGPTNASPAR